MRDFFERARMLSERDQLDEFEDDFRRVEGIRSSLQQSFSKATLDIDNLEEIFNAIEMSLVIGHLGSLDVADLTNARGSLVRLIGAVLERTQRFEIRIAQRPDHFGGYDQVKTLSGPAGYNNLAGFAKRMIEDDRRHHVSFLTFNYDLGLEVALADKKFTIDYCLDDSPAGALATSIQVIKLHGSLNWYRDDAESIRAIPVSTIMQRCPLPENADPCPLPLSSIYANYGPIPMSLADAVIVPPSESKGDTRHAMAPVWRAASTAIGSADVIVVVGFSLAVSDSFFRLFYAISSASDRLLTRFWVINKGNDVKERFFDLVGGHVKHHFMFTDQYFQDGLLQLESYYREHHCSL